MGNCFEACVASILELPIGKMPKVSGSEAGWWFRMVRAVNKLGYRIEYFTAKQQKPPRNRFYIMGGMSPRGNFRHAVVAKNGKMVHDPYPSRDGIKGKPIDYFLIRKIRIKSRKLK